MTLDEVIFNHTVKTFKENNLNRTRTAKSLGICIRTLRNYINEWYAKGWLHDELLELDVKESVPSVRYEERKMTVKGLPSNEERLDYLDNPHYNHARIKSYEGFEQHDILS